MSEHDVQTGTQVPDMVWIDIETTGLDPAKDLILEVGIILTDKVGRQLGHRAYMIDHPLDPRQVTGMMVPFVFDMHERSGLNKEWADQHEVFSVSPPGPALSHLSLIETQLLQFLVVDNNLPVGKYPMAGSSVHFDREFLKAYMPNLAAFFHYRNIDVSTVKNLCDMLNPPVSQGLEESKKNTIKTHRVVDDIINSIGDYIFYLDNFLFTV